MIFVKLLMIVFILLLIYKLLSVLNKSINNEHFTINNNEKNDEKMCIFRILGNNLNSVHSDTQTYDNLKFTLENEEEFENCDKIWILNRIVDKNLELKYKQLLDTHNKKYLSITFIKSDYKKINNNKNVDLKTLKEKNEIFLNLYQHSLYLININGARNFCLEYGRPRYLYSFVFDGSCFFTENQFNEIINKVDTENEYLIIPLIRLNKNEDFNNLKNKQKYEPQIAFKNTSTLFFNEKLPYGLSNKTELLRCLKIKGIWDEWIDNYNILKIKDRPTVDAKTQIISSVCRLSNGTKAKQKSHKERSVGLLQLVKDVNKTL